MEPSEKVNRIALLIVSFLQGELNSLEEEELRSWLNESDENRALFHRMLDAAYLEKGMRHWDPSLVEEAWSRFAVNVNVASPVKKFSLRRAWTIAALLLPLLALALLLLRFAGKTRDPKPAPALATQDIHIFPKGNVAKLSFEDGESLILGGDDHRVLDDKDGARVTIQNNTLQYQEREREKEDKIAFHVLETPRGAEYEIVLSDGTRVKLNAASSLRFPSRFEGKQRIVFLTGEAYFEVRKTDDASTFVVMSDRSVVTVLGTTFNISAYSDDAAQRITLAEGAVKVSNTLQDLHAVKLEPGLQAIVTGSRQPIAVQEANLDQVLAWTRGLFMFEKESLSDIMTRLSRWYDVEIEFDPDVDKTMTFSGKIDRYDDIQDILSLLELTGKVSFSLSGKQLKVAKGKPGSTYIKTNNQNG